MVKIDLRISRGGCLILDGNSKGYEVGENIAKTFEVNPWILSKLKKNPFEA